MSGDVRRGFTLLEALVALVLVATVVAAALGSFGTSLRGAALVNAHAHAVALADVRMSELTLVPAESLAYYAQAREGIFAPPFERYRWRARLARAPRSPALLRATVVVSWRDGQYPLATEIFRRELQSSARWRAR